MDQNSLDKDPIEFCLKYKEDPRDLLLLTEYFNSPKDARDFIKENKIVVYMLIKEEVIASRYEPGY